MSNNFDACTQSVINSLYTRFTVNGEVMGGSYDAPNDIRLKQFHERFPDCKTVMELGCFEGGHTFGLAKKAEVVIALEGRQGNIERARVMCDLLKVDNVIFAQVDLQTTALCWANVDVAFVVGCLYHLPRPWELLINLARVTNHLFIWTHYAETNGVGTGGYRGEWYKEGGLQDQLSGLHEQSFWPTRADLLRMLADTGFPAIEIIEEDRRNNAACITLTASK